MIKMSRFDLCLFALAACAGITLYMAPWSTLGCCLSLYLLAQEA